MRTRMWIGLGLIVTVAALILGVTGIALAQGPAGTMGWHMGGMMNGGMMNGGMMNGGMMNGGMMNGGMMRGRAPQDPNQVYDLRFLDDMIAHHQMGVMMTQHMVSASPRPEMQDLAQRIITAQQREITQMQQWRQQWYPGAPAGGMMGGMMGGMRGGMGSMMGGMGGMMNGNHMRDRMGPNADFDRMFLQMMIPHHEDAITMAEQALRQAEHPEIKTLAQAIITSQRAENEEMRGYLRDWYGIR